MPNTDKPSVAQLEPAGNVNIQATPGRPAKGPRYGYVDLLRGLALIVMIETHVINAYLPGPVRESPLYFWLTFVNGLVAPTFLFATGFSIILLGNRQWDDWLHLRMPFWRSMRRLGFITLVAYYTHIHDYKLSRYFKSVDPNKWRETLQVDVLQCIVASLLLIHILIFLLRRRDWFAYSAGALAIIVTLITPWMWSMDFTGKVPLGLALFLNPHGISLFPLFPWTCFVLSGSCISYFFLRAVEKKQDARFMKFVGSLGAVLIAGGLLLRQVPFTLPGKVNYFTTSPLYVFIRLGCVMAICALLYRWEKAGRPMPRLVVGAGQESLLVYGAHLWLVYGVLRSEPLGSILGKEAGYLWCFAASGLIILIMLWAAKAWHALKANYSRPTRIAQAATVLGLIIVFLIR